LEETENNANDGRRSPRKQCRFARLRTPPLDSFGRDNQHDSGDVLGEVTVVVGGSMYGAGDGRDSDG
jgi:uncharacterized protein YcfJ